MITELAEMGVADHVLESISGHLSRRMLEHYSHIRVHPLGFCELPSLQEPARFRLLPIAEIR